ncbi:hypothetical protein SELMODRAFT_413871 [Selaginella moellendorffii]|uniref:Replication factor A C-terminal domain-containing protein n=1 Tax=Selaginella moellendorffii TaxID=88036 RepID=D8RQH5_SELML|nr:hypothetical protein SELMODRAFT_413871 [Selaginella moellendorffii]
MYSKPLNLRKLRILRHSFLVTEGTEIRIIGSDDCALILSDKIVQGTVYSFSGSGGIRRSNQAYTPFEATWEIQANKGHSVDLCLWDLKAEEEGSYIQDSGVQPIICVKGGKVLDYNGKSLSAIGVSTILIEPEMEAMADLREWMTLYYNVTNFIHLSTSSSRQTISCTTTLSEISNMQLKMCIEDSSSHVWAIAFQEAAQEIVGMPAKELATMQDENYLAFSLHIDGICSKIYNFKIRSKLEKYQDMEKLRFYILGLHT